MPVTTNPFGVSTAVTTKYWKAETKFPTLMGTLGTKKLLDAMLEVRDSNIALLQGDKNLVKSQNAVDVGQKQMMKNTELLV